MPEQEKFTDEEWYNVLAGPFSAGSLVMAASPSGLTGIFAETQGMLKAMSELAGGAANPFVQEIAANLKQKPEAAIERRESYKSIAEAREGLLNRVRQVAFLVDSKVSADDAKAYKALMLGVAQRVAEAALEGGVLGIGGTRVSEAEQKQLEELKTLLGF